MCLLVQTQTFKLCTTSQTPLSLSPPKNQISQLAKLHTIGPLLGTASFQQKKAARRSGINHKHAHTQTPTPNTEIQRQAYQACTSPHLVCPSQPVFKGNIHFPTKYNKTHDLRGGYYCNYLLTTYYIFTVYFLLMYAHQFKTLLSNFRSKPDIQSGLKAIIIIASSIVHRLQFGNPNHCGNPNARKTPLMYSVAAVFLQVCASDQLLQQRRIPETTSFGQAVQSFANLRAGHTLPQKWNHHHGHGGQKQQASENFPLGMTASSKSQANGPTHSTASSIIISTTRIISRSLSLSCQEPQQ